MSRKNWLGLQRGVERAKNLRCSGDYRRAFSLALKTASAAKRQAAPGLELEALWEAMDSGKTVFPEKRPLLESLGRRSLSLASSSGDESLTVEARLRWGALLRVFGRHEKAAHVLSGALRSPAAKRDAQLAGYGFWNLGFALRMCARVAPAKAAFEKSLSLFRSSRDASGQAYALCGLAGITRLGGNAALSLRRYQQAGKIFDREDDLYGKAYTRCGMGNALRRMGRFREALGYYDQAHKIYRRLGDGINEGYVLWGRFVCRDSLGMRGNARKDLRRAERLFHQGRDERGTALLRVWAGLRRGKAGSAALKEARLS